MARRNRYIQICLLPRADVPEHCEILEIYASAITMDENAVDRTFARYVSFSFDSLHSQQDPE